MLIDEMPYQANIDKMPYKANVDEMHYQANSFFLRITSK